MSEYTPQALAAARDYFRQPEPKFWIWGDDAISWSDGVTIVFHSELAQILRRLAMDGLPRFTPLLLLLAACRDSYRPERVREALAHEKSLLTGSSAPLGPASDELLAALDRVAALPADLRSTIEAKVTLIETVFEGRRFFPTEHALGLVELVRSMPPRELVDDGVPADTRPHVTSALLVMGQALRQLDVEALRLRLRTGLEQLVEPAEIEPPEDESIRSFISRLREDPELAGLGRLAHDLLAAVQVPRAVSDPDDLRLGGVSDIANRGPLDRLLVSELAHDDLTLAVRVAVGEALYLRREAPPRTPVRERCLLVDCGLRLWGVPRVFATAVALALAATTDRHTQVAAWRAAGREIEPAELGNREGLVAHLERLEPAPHPAATLPRFFETLDRLESETEAIVITHEDVLADRDFRRALAELKDRSCYLATVDRGGRFRLLAHCGRGTKLIREAQFDLERLLSPTGRPKKPLIKDDALSDLPLIFSVEPFPLRLPHQINAEHLAFHEKHGTVTVTHDRRLMHWREAGLGAIELTALVPKGTLHLVSLADDGIVRLVAGGGPNAPLSLLTFNLPTGASRVMTIGTNAEAPVRAIYERQVLYLIGKQAVRAITDEGQLSPALECRLKHAAGRFFTWGQSVWYALSFDGQSPQLTRVPIHASIDVDGIATMFDIQGLDGPWVITNSGRVAGTLDGTNLWDGFGQGSVHDLRISDFGRTILLVVPTGIEELVLEMDSRRMKHRPTAVTSAWRPGLSLTQTGSLPHRFHQIGINSDGYLTLIGRRGRAVSFGPRQHPWPRTESRADSHGSRQAHLVIATAAAGELRQARTFTPGAGPPGVGYSLRVAHWSDGSRAWLDSRGLLHLKSGDRNVAELTLVLVPSGELAAWSSDGRMWGPAFYTGLDRQQSAAGADLLAAIDAFLVRLQ